MNYWTYFYHAPSLGATNGKWEQQTVLFDDEDLDDSEAIRLFENGDWYVGDIEVDDGEGVLDSYSYSFAKYDPGSPTREGAHAFGKGSVVLSEWFDEDTDAAIVDALEEEEEEEEY